MGKSLWFFNALMDLPLSCGGDSPVAILRLVSVPRAWRYQDVKELVNAYMTRLLSGCAYTVTRVERLESLEQLATLFPCVAADAMATVTLTGAQAAEHFTEGSNDQTVVN